MKIIFFIFLFSFNYYSNIFIKCIKESNTIIFFDLDNIEDLIIKDIFISEYNEYFNFIIDTMGFISGLFLSKKLRYEYMNGNTFSPINSFRTFEGHISDLNFQNYEKTCNNTSPDNSDFPIVIFKVYNKIPFYDKNKSYNGVLGLALNYTDEVLLDERYFFGESKKYSIMYYLQNNLKIIDKNIFSIYKNKFILGDININTNNDTITDINYCRCGDNIYDSFIYFFWNCDIETILINNTINNYYNNIKISLLFDTLLKDYLLSTNIKIANIILNQINNEFLNLNICYINININELYIYCNNDYYDEIYNMNLKIILNNKTYIELPFYLIIKNKTEKYFYLNIEINEFNIDKNQNIIKIGKDLFKIYYVLFDQSNKSIGLQKLENFKIFLDEKYNYKNLFLQQNYIGLDEYKISLINTLFIIIVSISTIGIIILVYAKKYEEI